MCLSIPAQVIELQEGGHARVNIGGITKTISVQLVEDLKIGDYVLVHVGHALTKLDADEAQKTLDLVREVFPDEAFP